jgi:hypothetical protein
MRHAVAEEIPISSAISPSVKPSSSDRIARMDRDQMRRLREEGKSLREISDAMGLSLTTTARILKTA